MDRHEEHFTLFSLIVFIYVMVGFTFFIHKSPPQKMWFASVAVHENINSGGGWGAKPVS